MSMSFAPNRTFGGPAGLRGRGGEAEGVRGGRGAEEEVGGIQEGAGQGAEGQGRPPTPITARWLIWYKYMECGGGRTGAQRSPFPMNGMSLFLREEGAWFRPEL